MKNLIFSAALVFSIGLVGCNEKTSDEDALIKEASNKETLPLGDNEDGKVSQEFTSST
ncbi:hypothetical protein [Solibacillus isronensis]|uniref:hypothetical protein n=1 Tax=Solibacillus isronensis TaxID=412383 RepID=UPI0039A009EB